MSDSKPPSTELDQRAVRAREIAAHPGEYKVCEGCSSIVRRQAVLCPNCHSYRYDGGPERVIAQARELGGRTSRSVASGDLLA